MKPVYNLKALEDILNDFHQVTQLSVNLYNQNFDLLVTAVRPSPFCRVFQDAARKRGIKKPCGRYCGCKVSSEKNGRDVTPTLFSCPMGLWGVAVPIKKEKLLLGYLLIGHVRRVDTLADAHPQTDWLEPDEIEKLETAFKSLLYYDDRRVQSLIDLVSSLLLTTVTEGVAHIQSDSPAQRIADFVDDHLSEKLTAETICRALNISRSALYDISNRFLGYSIADYIRQRRLRKAMLLLQDTNLSVAAIAEQCGFSNTIQLDKVMKRCANTTPRLYRQTSRKTIVPLR